MIGDPTTAGPASSSQPPQVPVGRLAGVLGLAMALGTLTQFVLGALGPHITTDLAIGRATFGLAVTALFACGFVLAPVAGGVVDRIGGRRALLALCAAETVAMAGLAVATSVWWFALIAAGGGVDMALANPATNRVVRARSSPQRRGTVVGITQAGVQAGALTAGLLAAASAWLGGWRGVAGLLAGLGVVAVVLVLHALPALPTPARHRDGDTRAPVLTRPDRHPRRRLCGADGGWLRCGVQPPTPVRVRRHRTR